MGKLQFKWLLHYCCGEVTGTHGYITVVVRKLQLQMVTSLFCGEATVANGCITIDVWKLHIHMVESLLLCGSYMYTWLNHY